MLRQPRATAVRHDSSTFQRSRKHQLQIDCLMFPLSFAAGSVDSCERADETTESAPAPAAVRSSARRLKRVSAGTRVSSGFDMFGNSCAGGSIASSLDGHLGIRQSFETNP